MSYGSRIANFGKTIAKRFKATKQHSGILHQPNETKLKKENNTMRNLKDIITPGTKAHQYKEKNKLTKGNASSSKKTLQQAKRKMNRSHHCEISKKKINLKKTNKKPSTNTVIRCSMCGNLLCCLCLVCELCEITVEINNKTYQ